MGVKNFERIIELKDGQIGNNRIAIEKLKVAEDCFNNQKGICPGCGKPIIFDYAFFRVRCLCLSVLSTTTNAYR